MSSKPSPDVPASKPNRRRPKEVSTGHGPFQPWRIVSPIPLLALAGILFDGILGLLAYSLTNNLQIFLAIAAVSLPLIWLIIIYDLIKNHYQKLYGPADYDNSSSFYMVFERLGAASRVDKQNQLNDFTPFQLTGKTAVDDINVIRKQAHFFESILGSVSDEVFFAMHSWFYENKKQREALLAIDMAIATGLISSKIYGFRSASLRHLGRLHEAKVAAELALHFDANNLDAKYNLARILKAMGQTDEADRVAKFVWDTNAQVYGEKMLASGFIKPTT